MDTSHNEEKKWYRKRENYLIILGIIIVFVAVLTPFSIIYFNRYKYNLKSFELLGTVGDFFGGTTVGLLSLASLIFVTAAMFMQKEELELQRKEVTATRKEYEITNKTMKKQSFDSTFFNMITLHQSILSNVKISEDSNRVAFEKLYFEFKTFIKNKETEIWGNILFTEFYYKEARIDIIEKIFVTTDRDKLERIEKAIQDYIDKEILEDSKYYISKEEEEKRDNFFIFLKSLMDNNFNLNSNLITEENSKTIFSILANGNCIDGINLDTLKEKQMKNLLFVYKKNLYEKFYEEHENMIGHYYRNLYRIVKYIHGYDFGSNELFDNVEVNEKEQKEYRGILRAQLSSYELLMLFYNICYSDKGKKFRILLESTNFFDNHLVEEDFIWDNDIEQLKYF